MNMQAMMRQAQNMQREMMKTIEEVDKKEFEGESGLVKVKANGKKEILSINIDKEATLEKDDLEMLEDMIVVAINNTFEKVDDYKENKLSKYGNISGLL